MSADDLLARAVAVPSRQAIAGSVVGVSIGDSVAYAARGIANLNTGLRFEHDTGWLLGSVTKVMVAGMIMQLVDSGRVDLDAPVSAYAPEFALRHGSYANEPTVRMLLNHTNGIDADWLWPTAVRGRDASRSYTEHLRHLGVVFEPGSSIHYSNPGYVLAARIIEEHAGAPFEQAVQRDLFDPLGMKDSTLVQTQALLRSTAVGAFSGPDGRLRTTSLFTYPESGAGAGTTAIVTAPDMLAYGRMHLRHGDIGKGRSLLSHESIAAMQTVSAHERAPLDLSVGLGWWIHRLAGTTVLWHGGASSGGRASLAVIPEYDAVVVSFATGPGSTEFNDQVVVSVVEDLTGRSAEPIPREEEAVPDERFSGLYSSFQKRVAMEVSGRTATVSERFEAYDEDHLLHYEAQTGTPPDEPATQRLVPIRRDLLAPAGAGPADLRGPAGRMSCFALLRDPERGLDGIHHRLRFIPRRP